MKLLYSMMLIGSGLELTVANEEADRLARKETKKLKYRNHEIQKPLKKRRKLKTMAI
ncbi:MAG: hypothetical protein ACR5K5_06665 [Wolbachia sp.]